METHSRGLQTQQTTDSKDKHLLFENLPVDFNWNTEYHESTPIVENLPAEPTPEQIARTQICSECLRDGLHGVNKHPPTEQLLHYASALADFGIKAAMVGVFPGENNSVNDSTKALLKGLRDQVPGLVPTLLCLPCGCL